MNDIQLLRGMLGRPGCGPLQMNGQPTARGTRSREAAPRGADELKSDNLIHELRRLTATEAARRFSELLDRVEREGETFLVERRGRAVASIRPAAAVSGRAVKELLRSQAPDPGWPEELAELRGSLEPEDRRWNG